VPSVVLGGKTEEEVKGQVSLYIQLVDHPRDRNRTEKCMFNALLSQSDAPHFCHIIKCFKFKMTTRLDNGPDESISKMKLVHDTR
jgi:hypothetical protein